MLLSEINWNVTSIAIVVVGCWLLAEFIEFFEDQKRMKQRYTKDLGLTLPLLPGTS
jgi:hypothetical protein